MEFRTFSEKEYELVKDDKGYMRLNVGEGVHPYSHKGHVYVHRVVMEEHLGRFLRPDEVIHHINEIKDDNRLQNLYLCSAQEHVEIHNRGRHNSLAKRAKIASGVRKANQRRNK